MKDEAMGNNEADRFVEIERRHNQAVISANRITPVTPTPTLETTSNHAVLAVIAAKIGESASNFRIENDSVFYDMPDGAIRCACAVGTPYWLEAVAASTQEL